MKYREIFKKKNTLLVVIHAEVFAPQVLSNLHTCWDNGVDGVFLINHSVPPQEFLEEIYGFSRDFFEDKWIGLNILGLSSKNALSSVPVNASGLWVDNAGIEDDDSKTSADLNWKFRKEKRIDWPGLYFGGVAFKYQAPVKNLAEVSKAATNYMDVVTTSGSATGSAPDLGKIETMRKAIGDFPLAVASGITPENVGPYRDLVDCFLISTGISKSHTELDPARVVKMAEVLNR